MERKNSIIFKICVISILIILSTIGTISNSYAVTRMEGGEFTGSDNGLVYQAHSDGNSQAIDLNNVGLETLDNNVNVLCDGLGIELDSLGAQSTRPEYDIDLNAEYAEKGEDKTKYSYSSQGKYYADFRESYILAGINDSLPSGYPLAHYGRWTQTAWWAAYHSHSNKYASAGLLGTLDFGNSSTAYDVYSPNYNFMAFLGQKADINEKEISSELAAIIGYQEIRRDNVQEILANLLINPVFQSISKDDPKKGKLVEEILEHYYTPLQQKWLKENGEWESTINDYITNGYKYYAEGGNATQTYYEFIKENINEDRTLKDSAKPKLDTSKAKTAFEDSTNCFVIGPIVADYAYYDDDDGHLLAGIVDEYLEVIGFSGTTYKTKSGNNNSNLRYTSNYAPDQGEYTFRASNEYKFTNENNEDKYYPRSKQQFYIVLGNNSDYKALATIRFSYEYTYFDGEYERLVGEYKDLKWTKLNYYDIYYNCQSEQDENNSLTYSSVIGYYYSSISEDNVKEGEFYNHWSGNNYYRKTDTKYKAEQIKIGESQPLIINLGAEVSYYRIPFEATFDIPRNVTVKKDVIDVNGNNINFKIDRTFRFKIYEDGKEVNELTVKGGESKTVPISSFNIQNKKAKVTVEEVDAFGNKYEDVKDKLESLPDGSIWKDGFKPENVDITTNDSGDVTVSATNIFDLHSHLKLIKEFKKDELGENSEYNLKFNVHLVNGDKSSNAKISYTIATDDNGNVDKTVYNLETTGGLNGEAKIEESDGYVRIIYTSDKIQWNTPKAPTYEITELDIPEEFEPEYKARTGSLEKCFCEQSGKKEKKYTATSVFNKINTNTKIVIEADKITSWGDNKDEYTFDVVLYKKVNDELKLFKIDTLNLVSNTGEKKSVSFDIFNATRKDKYVIRVFEQNNSHNNFWSDVISDDDWQVRYNYDGSIGYIEKEFIGGESANWGFTAVNGMFTGVKVEKRVKTIDGDQPEYPDAFYFIVSHNSEDQAEKFFANDILIDENTNEPVVSENGYKVVRIPNRGNNEYYLDSDIVEWTKNKDPKAIVALTFIEVDQFGKKYSKKPEEGSIWEDWIPSKESDEIALTFYKTRKEAEDARDENLLPVEILENTFKSTNLTVDKEIAKDGITEEDKDIVFNAKVVITKSMETSSSAGTRELKVDGNIIEDSEYTQIVEISVNKEPQKILNISWKGEAPTYSVTEINIPEEWNLDGYKVNGEFKSEISDVELKQGDNANQVIVRNKYDDTKYVSFNLTKLVYNSQEALSPIEEGENFYYELKVIDDNDNEFTENFIITKGSEPVNSKLYPIEKGKTLRYVLTEYDSDEDTRITYETFDASPDEYPDSLWNYYTPKDGTGIQKGTVKAEENKNITVSLIGSNKFRDIPFTKKISGKNGDIEEIKPGEKFYFVVEEKNTSRKEDFKEVDIKRLKELFPEKYGNTVVTLEDSNRAAVMITYDNSTGKAFVAKSIKLRKQLEYRITEVDQYGDTTAQKPKSIWKRYNVTNGVSWNPTEEQPYHEFINERKTTITIQKQVDGEWTEPYYFDLYVNGTKFNEKPLEFTKSDNNKSYTIDAKYIDYDGNVTVKLVELGENKVKEAYLNESKYTMGSEVTVNVINYNDNGKENPPEFVFNITNNGGGTDNRGHIRVVKKIDKEWKGTVTFKYRYIDSNGDNIIPEKGTAKETIEFTGNEKEAYVDLPTVEWGENEPAPKFEVSEISVSGFTLKSISSDADDSNVDENNVVTGTIKEEKVGTVTVTAENVSDKHGHLRVIKDFKMQDKLTFEQLKKLLEANGYDTTFTFTVKISNLNPDDKVNGISPTNGVVTIPKDVSINDLNEKGNVIFDDIRVDWSGDHCPVYNVTESHPGEFWKSVVSDNASSYIKECTDKKHCPSEVTTVTITNHYHDKLEFITRLGGRVWIDGKQENKVANADGIFDKTTEVGASDVYVQVERLLVNIKDNSCKRQNNAQYKFSVDSDDKFIYIDENANGEWKLNVLAPAFSDKELEDYGYVEKKDGKIVRRHAAKMYSDGYRVRYDVKFFYDGVTYEPTTYLTNAEGNNIKEKTNYYKENSKKSELFNNSHAIETLKDRKEYNGKFTPVTGNIDMQSDYTSKGKMGNYDVYYEAYDVQTESDGVTRVKSKGSISRASVNENSYEEEFMMASTGNANLYYFFNNDFKIEEDGYVCGLCISNNDIIDSITYNLDNMDRLNVGDVKLKDDAIYYYYQAIYNYATNINLGLVEREPTDINISKRVEGVTIVLNERATFYPIDPITGGISFDDDKIFKHSADRSKDKFNIYTSEYEYRTSMYANTEVYDAYNEFYRALFGKGADITTKELQAYVTFAITINNQSPYEVLVSKIEDYSESSLTYVDLRKGYIASNEGALNHENTQYINTNGDKDSEEFKNSGLWAYLEDDSQEHKTPTNIFANNPKYYKDTFTYYETESCNIGSGNEKVNKAEVDINCRLGGYGNNNTRTYYATYRTNLDGYYTDENNYHIILGLKYNIVEIAEFAAYYSDGYKVAGNPVKASDNIPAAVLDKDSAPSNYNLANPYLMEDDTDYAAIKFEKAKDQIPIRKINGVAQDVTNGTTISGLDTRLVEVIDLPVVKDQKLTDDYIEYEFYWNDKKTLTGDDGKYEFDDLIPGNYIVRFFYGNNDATIKYNGEDYKTTVYKANIKDNSDFTTDGYVDNEWVISQNNETGDNEARDNEARRVEIIQRTQRLTNANTSIFDVANLSLEDYEKKIKSIIPDTDADLKEEYNSLRNKLKGKSVDSRIINGSTAYSGIIKCDDENQDGYYMFADTAKMNLKVAPKVIEDDSNRKLIEFTNMNLGLEERPKTNIELDKQIKEITLLDAKGSPFFHIEYNIEYTKDKPNLTSPFYPVSNNLYANLTVNTENTRGVDNLQAVNDEFKNGVITQGFRYINIDSMKLQGVTLNIKYQISAINLSEDDYYGKGLYDIMYEDDKETPKSVDDKWNSFNEAINELGSSDYVLKDANALEGSLNFKPIKKAKNYGRYVGRSYYTGKDKDKDHLVKSTVKQIVDYVDNDISFIEQENSNNGELWVRALATDLKDLGYVDAKILKDDKILDNKENPYLTIVCSSDSEEFNSNFVKELAPSNDSGLSEVKTFITESKTFASTDKGDTGVDNLIEIIVLENNVGRRDTSVVHGNYNPRGGAITTIERDSSASECVTLSPPTGLGRQKATAIEIMAASLVGAIVVAGGIILIKKKVL